MSQKLLKTNNRETAGRGLFYSRDSGGQHEQTPAQYVAWAKRKATELGVKFLGTPEEIARLIKNKQPHSGDLFFDDSVCGNQLSRPALNALKAEISGDRSVSHVFIPRRDRLARPDHALDGVQLEKELRELGVSLVYLDQTVPPLTRGRRQDIGEAITAYMAFEQSGKFRDELAEKMIYAQLQLAKNGYTTGGRAPFGFRRNLINVDGKVIRQLEDSEIIRQKGHHVVWLPGPDEELDLIRRILTMLEAMRATQVARTLTEEGIPSPDAGRRRTDNGISHAVSGIWHHSTVNNIARNPLLRATTAYGRRSMGDRRRFTSEGPRLVDQDTDYRHDKKPKVVQNSESQLVVSPAHFKPVIPVDQFDRLQKTLDERAGTQRGKPRSRNPNLNPLGGRVFDMSCGWPMYRTPYTGSFRYTCGYYQQSHGQCCEHNHIAGPLATKFALAAIRQTLLSPRLLDQLAAKIRERVEARPDASLPTKNQIQDREHELNRIEAQIKTATRNLALVENPDEMRGIQDILAELRSNRTKLHLEPVF